MDQILVRGSSGDAGFDDKQLNLIEQRAEENWVDGKKTRALALCAARDGVVAIHKALGQRTADDDEQVTLDTMFTAGSISKIVTATAVMMLAERGLIGITRFVKDYIPELKARDSGKILVRHLLTHTSGFTEEKCFGEQTDHEA